MSRAIRSAPLLRIAFAFLGRLKDTVKDVPDTGTNLPAACHLEEVMSCEAGISPAKEPDAIGGRRLVRVNDVRCVDARYRSTRTYCLDRRKPRYFALAVCARVRRAVPAQSRDQSAATFSAPTRGHQDRSGRIV